jgi:hypothetical protein
MIGPKKLSTIRQELRQALAATGEDPIRWLEERVTARRNQQAADSGRNEILDSLQRFLQATPGEKRPRQRAGAKK